MLDVAWRAVVHAVITGGLMAFVLAINPVTGWIVAALVVWAAWAHHVSSISSWLLSTVIVVGAVLLFLAGVLIPRPVKRFLQPVMVGLTAAAGIAFATTQWVPAISLAIGALLAGAVRRSAVGVEAHIRDNEQGQLHG